MFNKYLPLFIVMLMIGASFSTGASLKIVEPYNATLNNGGSIYLGSVGPGQPFYITALSSTQNNSGVTILRGWNIMNVSHMPSGWIATNSSTYTQYLSVFITPSPNTTTGTYEFNVSAQNVGNYSKLGIVHFTAYVNVTPNVFKLNVYPNSVSAGPGQPVEIYVQINNTGVSDSPFYITASGLPAWNRTNQVIALHQTSRTFIYPLYEQEPGSYKANITVLSSASSRIKKSAQVNLTIQASVPNDYQAIGDGSVGFPVIYEPAYAFMYLINLILRNL